MQLKQTNENLPAGEDKHSLPGEARIGPILSLPQVLTELGVSPEQALRQAGIPISDYCWVCGSDLKAWEI